MSGQDTRTIKSAHRVLEILEYFDQDHRHTSVMEMARALDFPQSSTSELLRCLTRLGYLHYNRFKRTYSPTARVALLGSWVEPSLFRGGPVLSAIDHIFETVGETVVLSTATNYVVQHLHVIHGARENSVEAHAGDTASLLHSPQGRLVLSSLRDDHIRSALHRLNAEQEDPEMRVRMSDMIAELKELQAKPWIVTHHPNGEASVAVLLPMRKGMRRLVLSVLALGDTIDSRWEEIVEIILEHSEELATQAIKESACDRVPEPHVPSLTEWGQRAYA